MNKAFEENIELLISAAQIGISKSNWDFAEVHWTKNQAQEFMLQNSYDVLPIKSKSGEFKNYWTTEKSGEYETIVKKTILESNKIYYLTELADLLRKFKESENTSYFLTNHSEVNGLVSNVNLNSKPVYIYFYSLISKIEIDLGNWLKELISEKDIINLIKAKGKNQNDELSAETLKRYNADKKQNKENHFVEYLYFSQFQYLVKKKKLTSSLGYNSNKRFEKDFKIISKYRNWFAHPLNSSVSNLSEDLLNLHIALKNLIGKIEGISIELLKAYFETKYKTNSTPIFSIRIGAVNNKLNQYMKKKNFKNWSFITAENPNSIKLSDDENSKKNEWLETILRKNRYQYMRGTGIPNNSEWQPENSFIIFNIGLNKSIELCKKFMQNAFVYGEIDEIVELKRINHER